MAYPRLAFAVLPITRLELPGWGRLMRAVRLSVPPGDETWRDAPTVTARGKAHGYLMELDLRDWAERMTYCLGRYYELQHQFLIKRVVKPADRVVGVGANIGMISLLLAKAVGPSGLVESFEPNPGPRARLQRMLDLNRIGWARVHPFGLSDEPGELTLSVLNHHTGVGSFAPVDPANESAVTERVSARIERGDDVLLADPRPVRFVKIDVEGFETRAIRGLRGLLERDRPTVVLETVESNLRQAGSSAEELFGLMRSLGYRAMAMDLRRRGLRHALDLRPVGSAADANAASDTVWTAS